MKPNEKKITDALRYNLSQLTPVEWGEKNRVLSKKDSRFYGPLSFGRTPYWIKPTNCFSPDNPTQIVSIMKGSQIGFSSVCIYTILGWIIGESPANTLFITENDAKLKDQMQGPIDQMINSSGLANKVGSHNLRERQAKGRRKKATGDTLTGIDFGDGFLYTLSGQVISSLSSWNIKYGIYDEVERWKGVYKSAGDFTGLVDPRHRAYGNERKQLFGSTPEIEQTSNIKPLYLAGNQQKYNIPCIHCGTMIDFRWTAEVDGGKAGIHFERDNLGKFIENSALYVCQSCGGTFKESHKWDMYEETYAAYKNGSELVCDWIPTAEPESYFHESYHISSLYAPNGFYSWNDMARKWCEIHPKNQPVKIRKLQVFFNQELGETWEERSRDIKSNQLLKNGRSYDINTVPVMLSQQDGNGKIVLLTCAVDLNGTEDDARLDYEVVAWCENGSSYSIDHGSIGSFQRSNKLRYKTEQERIDYDNSRVKFTYKLNQANNVWDEFEKEVMLRTYQRDDGKGTMKVPIFGIDTGFFTVHANSFVYKHQNCVALKGKKDNKYTKYDVDKFLYQKSSKQEKLYNVEGNKVKDLLADNMGHEWSEHSGIDQPPGFMNFPIPTEEKYSYKTYFHEYEGEKMEFEINDFATAIGSRWVKKHSTSANHFWDCRCYNIVSQHIFTEMFCKAAKITVSWENYVNFIKNSL